MVSVSSVAKRFRDTALLILDFWNSSAQLDSLFHKSLLLSHSLGERPGKQAGFSNRLFQKYSNSRLKNFMGKVPKFILAVGPDWVTKVN